MKVGLEPGEPGCNANVLILADSEADALASRLVKDSLRHLAPPDNDAGSLGRSELRKFEVSDAPVRWWHVSQTVMTDTGQAIKDGKQVTVRQMGRTKKNVREDMVHVLIILDTQKIGVVSFASLADYISVVALAQIDAEADMHRISQRPESVRQQGRRAHIPHDAVGSRLSDRALRSRWQRFLRHTRSAPDRAPDAEPAGNPRARQLIMRGTVASICRHPVKGLTPEQLGAVQLEAGATSRVTATTPSRSAPPASTRRTRKHISKQRFTVLARFPALARIKTRLDDATGAFHVGDASGFGVETRLDTEDGRAALERFLQAFLGEDAPGKLRVLESPQGYRFMDHPAGLHLGDEPCQRPRGGAGHRPARRSAALPRQRLCRRPQAVGGRRMGRRPEDSARRRDALASSSPSSAASPPT